MSQDQLSIAISALEKIMRNLSEGHPAYRYADAAIQEINALHVSRPGLAVGDTWLIQTPREPLVHAAMVSELYASVVRLVFSDKNWSPMYKIDDVEFIERIDTK